MTHLPSLLLFAVVRKRGEEDGREGGCLLGVILGGRDTILIFCIWEERGETRRGEEEKRSSHLTQVHGHITLHTHLTGPLAFWSEFA